MVYDAMVSQAAETIRELNLVLSRVDYSRNFPGKGELRANTGRFREATQHASYIIEMLRKLKHEEFIEVYKKCRGLAQKYKLSGRDKYVSGNNIEIPHAAAEYNSFYFDAKRPPMQNSFFLVGGWESGAPQRIFGYCEKYDKLSVGMGFNIHGTRFILDDSVVLRLWKGFYAGFVGGEIGFYGSCRAINANEIMDMIKAAIRDLFEQIGILPPGSGTAKLSSDIDGIVRLSADDAGKRLLDLVFSTEKTREILSTTMLRIPMGERNNIFAQVKSLLLEIIFAPDTSGLKYPLLQRKVSPEAFSYFYTVTINITRIKTLLKELSLGNLKFDDDYGYSLKEGELRGYLGLTGTVIQVYLTEGRKLITEHWENSPKFWTTTFRTLADFGLLRNVKWDVINIKQHIYTVNHFHFENGECADRFLKNVDGAVSRALGYSHNKDEPIRYEKTNDTTAVIVYGKEQ